MASPCSPAGPVHETRHGLLPSTRHLPLVTFHFPLVPFCPIPRCLFPVSCHTSGRVWAGSALGPLWVRSGSALGLMTGLSSFQPVSGVFVSHFGTTCMSSRTATVAPSEESPFPNFQLPTCNFPFHVASRFWRVSDRHLG